MHDAILIQSDFHVFRLCSVFKVYILYVFPEHQTVKYISSNPMSVHFSNQEQLLPLLAPVTGSGCVWRILL